MIFLLVSGSNLKWLLLLNSFLVFIAWISGDSLLLLLVCLYDVFFHLSINRPYCLSNFTVNLLMASRAASERICGECRRLYTLLDYYLFFIFFFVRYPLLKFMLGQLLILLLSKLLLQPKVHLLLFDIHMVGDHFVLYFLGFRFLRLFKR